MHNYKHLKFACIYDFVGDSVGHGLWTYMKLYNSFPCNFIGQGPFSCVILEGFFTPQFS